MNRSKLKKIRESRKLTQAERAQVILFILSLDKTAYAVFSRGRVPWRVMWQNAVAFDEHIKKFSAKR